MFELERMSDMGSDCTARYDVVLDREYTVKEFIDTVISEKPTEWGEIYITKNARILYDGDMVCRYNHGEIEDIYIDVERIIKEYFGLLTFYHTCFPHVSTTESKLLGIELETDYCRVDKRGKFVIRLEKKASYQDGLRPEVRLIDEMHLYRGKDVGNIYPEVNIVRRDEVDAYLYALKEKEFLNSVYGARSRASYKSHEKDIRNKIEKVIFNDPATIILWKDGTKTVVKCRGEEYDPEKGMALAICKKVLGNSDTYFTDVFKGWLPEEEKSKPVKFEQAYKHLYCASCSRPGTPIGSLVCTLCDCGNKFHPKVDPNAK